MSFPGCRKTPKILPPLLKGPHRLLNWQLKSQESIEQGNQLYFAELILKHVHQFNTKLMDICIADILNPKWYLKRNGTRLCVHWRTQNLWRNLFSTWWLWTDALPAMPITRLSRRASPFEGAGRNLCAFLLCDHLLSSSANFPPLCVELSLI